MVKLPDAPTHDAVALRGDYSKAAKDYTVPQEWDKYTDAEHALWKQLFERQSKLIERYAAPEFVAGVRALGAQANAIPRFEDANRVLAASTGWQIVAVPGLIPEENFFDHLANKRFPVTVWIRKPEEIDYLVEPDVFHDYFGHVPLLTNPIFARFMQAYGEAGPKAIALGGLKMLARLYWYMVEFGLIRTENGLKVYGSGILSSKGETVYSIESPKPHRIGFDLIRVMRTDYLIDDYQQTYFVLDSFEQLFEAGYNTDFAPIYREFATFPGYAPTTVLPSDKIF
jgi:phenylalanine-4-hydroxylase